MRRLLLTRWALTDLSLDPVRFLGVDARDVAEQLRAEQLVDVARRQQELTSTEARATAGFHRSGERDDFYPRVVELDRSDALLPEAGDFLAAELDPDDEFLDEFARIGQQLLADAPLQNISYPQQHPLRQLGAGERLVRWTIS